MHWAQPFWFVDEDGSLVTCSARPIIIRPQYLIQKSEQFGTIVIMNSFRTFNSRRYLIIQQQKKQKATIVSETYKRLQSTMTISGVKKSTSPTPGASNFHIWASWNNQLYARRASKKIYRILTTCQYSRIYLYSYMLYIV